MTDVREAAPDPTLSPALRAEALESLLLERGLIDTKTIETFIRTYETAVGPMNGAKVVAKAWTDPEFRRRLLEDGTAAIASMGFKGPQGEHMVVLENSPTVHNVVVCTLCSCYPIALLGPSPSWYKSEAYRSRVVRDPRGVLREFGWEPPAGTRISVWDASAESRYMVLPRRPDGTDDLTEEQLAGLVTRKGLIGTATV